MAIEAGYAAVQPYPAGASDFVSTLSRTLAAANRFLMTRLREEGLDTLVPSTVTSSCICSSTSP